MDERRLRKLFHFTEADLAANRRGRFSEDQNKRLSDEARKEQKSAWESAAILFVIAVAGLAVGLTIGYIAPTPVSRILMILLMGILWPSVWAGKGVQIIRAAIRLQEPLLRDVRGPVQVARHEQGEYTIRVERLEFDVDGNPSGTFTDGDEYTIYYLEATEEILSVDHLQSASFG
jgi:hypothetical protein